jgi:hypothetical protein
MIDFYDDTTGEVLRKKLPSLEDVPDFIKTAEKLDSATLDSLPDDVFALVAFDDGRKMRKFACTDKGNTALSVIYFMENKDRLPEEVQKLAASNLVKACQWYDMRPPTEMSKLALAGALTAALYGHQGAKDFSRRQKMLKAGVPGSQVMKTSELTGSYTMPMSKKIKEASLDPYIDITGMKPPVKIEKEVGQRNCLVKEGSAKYPIDTLEQVQKASDYFMEHRTDFTPFERHQYCIKLSSRADELGAKVPDVIEKYGSSTLSPTVIMDIRNRQAYFHEETPEHELLSDMMDKVASIKPEFLASTLEAFDKATDLDLQWDNGVRDPYYSVFGFEKKAEYSFSYGDKTVSETRLRRCASECRKQVVDLFGEDMANEFAKKPVQIFESLPLDNKRILMNMSASVEE